MTESSFTTCYVCGAHMALDLMTGETFCPQCGWISFADWPDEKECDIE